MSGMNPTDLAAMQAVRTPVTLACRDALGRGTDPDLILEALAAAVAFVVTASLPDHASAHDTRRACRAVGERAGELVVNFRAKVPHAGRVQ